MILRLLSSFLFLIKLKLFLIMLVNLVFFWLLRVLLVRMRCFRSLSRVLIIFKNFWYVFFVFCINGGMLICCLMKVVDWVNGKVYVGENEFEILKMFNVFFKK